jgi:hypothetical protein
MMVLRVEVLVALCRISRILVNRLIPIPAFAFYYFFPPFTSPQLVPLLHEEVGVLSSALRHSEPQKSSGISLLAQ